MRLYPLSQEHYSLVTSLLPANYPNITMVHAIIEGSLPGDIWVDDVAHPNTSLVMTKGEYCFIAGELNEQIFQAYYELLSSRPFPVKLVCESESIDFTKYGFSNISRLQFEFNPDKFPQHVKESNLDLFPINTEENLKVCNTYPLIKMMSEANETFLKYGKGYALKDKEKNVIASEVLAVIAKNSAEPNVFTLPGYQHQGLARFICHKLITDLVKSGRHPVWTCDKTNQASINLAQQLGMQQTREYEFKILKK